MQTRHRAAATALLLTAATGLAAATGGTAQASGTHTAHRAATKLVVTIKSKAGAVKLSDDKIRPGNTIFRVKNMDGKASKGLIQILRLRPGYTLTDAFNDFALAFPNGNTPADVPAVNRVYDNVVFYGGMEAKGKPTKVSKWAVKINKASTYYVVNLDQNTLTQFTAKGAKQRRSLPSKSGFINAEVASNPSGNTFVAGKHNATSGWMSTANNAKEPHFVDVEQVKKGTKNSDISKLFAGKGPNVFVQGGASADTGVISPGHRFLWAYQLPKARYGVLCFMPSRNDGVPHAIMGMHTVFNIR